MVKVLVIDDIFKMNRSVEFMMQSQEQNEYLIGEVKHITLLKVRKRILKLVQKKF